MLSISETEHPAGFRKEPIRMTGVSFAALDKYKDLVYRTALTVTGNREDAEDILQEVFFKYFRMNPVFEDESHEKAWLVRVTVNEGRNLRRSAWFRKRADVDLTLLPAEDDEPGDHEVLRAVLSLPEKYRTAIYLHYYEGYSAAEIGELTGRSAAAVGQHLSRGREKLRRILGGDRR